jgi:hypothetical protein
MEGSISDDRIKELIKSALREVLEEHRDLLQEALFEAIEDIALARAMQEGENTEDTSREEVFSLLER